MNCARRSTTCHSHWTDTRSSDSQRYQGLIQGGGGGGEMGDPPSILIFVSSIVIHLHKYKTRLPLVIFQHLKVSHTQWNILNHVVSLIKTAVSAKFIT